MATLAGSTIASTYTYLLKMDGTSGITGSLVAVQDGDATDSALKIGTNQVEVIPGSDSTTAFEVSQNGGTPVLSVDSTNQRVNIGSSSYYGTDGIALEVNSVAPGTGVYGGVSIHTWEASGASTGPQLTLARSKSDSAGNYAIVADDDRIGQIFFKGADSNSFALGATIIAYVDGSPSNGDMPTRLVFGTAADGSEAPADRMTILSDGKVGIGTAVPTEALTVSYGIGTESTLTGVLAIEGTDTSGADMVSGSGPSIDFRIPTSTTATHVAARIGCPREGGDEDANAGTLSFYTATTDDATASVKMTILKGGQVGIGTAAPDRAFVVANTSDSTSSGTGGAVKICLGDDLSKTVNIGYHSADYGFIEAVDESVAFKTMSINPDSGMVCIGETTNAKMTNGLTINQGSSDNEILALKSSDIAHGRTGAMETDTYANFKKHNATLGGLEIIAAAEDSALGTTFQIYAVGGTPSTSAAYNEGGLYQLTASEHDGSNAIANLTANGNVFCVRGYVGGGDRTLFNVDEDGDISYDGSDAGAYDYAEMFEWKDGNPDNEERHGYSVVLDGDKIRKAEDGETPIGIVSVHPAVCGDHPNEWHKTWKVDEWGQKIYKEVECVKYEFQHEKESAVEEVLWAEGDGLPEGVDVGDVMVEAKDAVFVTKEKHYEGAGIPDTLPDSDTIKGKTITPVNFETYIKLESQYSDDYDEEQSYSMRGDREEWSPVGLMGKLRMHKGQPTASSWIKMKDEGNDIEMWLIK
jgi:hypothetical protein